MPSFAWRTYINSAASAASVIAVTAIQIAPIGNIKCNMIRALVNLAERFRRIHVRRSNIKKATQKSFMSHSDAKPADSSISFSRLVLAVALTFVTSRCPKRHSFTIARE